MTQKYTASTARWKSQYHFSRVCCNLLVFSNSADFSRCRCSTWCCPRPCNRARASATGDARTTTDLSAANCCACTDYFIGKSRRRRSGDGRRTRYRPHHCPSLAAAVDGEPGRERIGRDGAFLAPALSVRGVKPHGPAGGRHPTPRTPAAPPETQRRGLPAPAESPPSPPPQAAAVPTACQRTSRSSALAPTSS